LEIYMSESGGDTGGLGGDTGGADGGGDGGGSTEVTIVTGDIYDSAGLSLSPGDTISVGIWSVGSLGTGSGVPDEADAEAVITTNWAGDGTPYNLSFDMQSGLTGDYQLYAWVDGGYGASEFVNISAGDTVTGVDIDMDEGGSTGGGDDTADTGPSTEATISGEIYDDSGTIAVGDLVSVELWSADELSADGWPTEGSSSETFEQVTWEGDGTEFTFSIDLDADANYRVFAIFDEGSDFSIDALGRTDEFTASPGEAVTGLSVTIESFSAP
jgi:hypothetical protein